MMRTSYLCEDCAALGRTTVAEEVHHIIPLRDGGADTDANTANLCIAHHLERESKTVRQRIAVDGWPV
jgi:5-methylcytosine-specific restriction endonuclease McrA